jgi:catechol 2,3-dioxygenase-like lactoylglutathione lyase family enzyme
MAIKARFFHTNLVSRDWKKLVWFYQDIFGCTPRGPERDMSGEWLERVTALPGARLRGRHLSLPGYGEEGPTLEIFSYDEMSERTRCQPNDPGFSHIAFVVEDVGTALEMVAAGGSKVGEMIMTEVEGVGSLQVVYTRDPEGNIVELQKWS